MANSAILALAEDGWMCTEAPALSRDAAVFLAEVAADRIQERAWLRALPREQSDVGQG